MLPPFGAGIDSSKLNFVGIHHRHMIIDAIAIEFIIYSAGYHKIYALDTFRHSAHMTAMILLHEWRQ